MTSSEDLLKHLPPTVRVTAIGGTTFVRCGREHVLNQVAAIMSGGHSVLIEDDAVANLQPGQRPSQTAERVASVMARRVLDDAVIYGTGVMHISSREFRRPSAAVEDVLEERRRQVNEEGWSAEHDDAHDDGDLALAGAAYAYQSTRHTQLRNPPPPEHWPWSTEWWKPGSRRRDLVKAGALILAEIERLDRASAAQH